jgi:hypothetical protein
MDGTYLADQGVTLLAPLPQAVQLPVLLVKEA